ncbi:MAG: N-acetylglucosaminyl-phosphatidylinositol de-N-acetylase [Sclerophora amabilis]|nr:MAG: N-acetylglucosaminyl-phosphatidylinositol de-N-acetylase [Sclerophora amabilis]
MQWLATALALPFFFIFCWLYTVHFQRSGGSVFPRLRNKRICLLIAHPDDEAMFFAPTLQALTERELGNHVKILCLSSGDADGLGETRKKELVKSGLMLGIRKEEDVFVVEDPNFPDSMTASWEPSLISNLLAHAFAPNLGKSKPNPSSSTAGAASSSSSLLSSSPTATIDVLITFDSHGISSHPNHISLYRGARHFLTDLMKRHPGWACPVTMYTLTTTGLARKYISIADAALTTVQLMLFSKKQMKKRADPPSPLLFVSSPKEVRMAQTSMTRAHRSQMRWFRWGWIGLSRYMVVNDLKLEKI